MTALEMAKLIGTEATYPVKDLSVAVTIIDARNRFGSADVLITPVAGSGATWVALTSVVTS